MSPIASSPNPPAVAPEPTLVATAALPQIDYKTPEPVAAGTIPQPTETAAAAPIQVSTPANPASDFHATPEPVVLDLRKVAPPPVAAVATSPAVTASAETPAPAPAPTLASATLAVSPSIAAQPISPVITPGSTVTPIPQATAAPIINKLNRADVRLANAQATPKSDLIQKFGSHDAPAAAAAADITAEPITTTPAVNIANPAVSAPVIKVTPSTVAKPNVMADAPKVPIVATVEASDLVTQASQPTAPKPIPSPVVKPLVAEAPTTVPIDLTAAGRPTEPVLNIPNSPYPALKGVQPPAADPATGPTPTAITTTNPTALPIEQPAVASTPTPVPVATAAATPSPVPVVTSAVMPPMVSTQVEANKQLLTPDLMAKADPETARKEAFALAMANAPKRNTATSAVAAAVAVIIMGGYIWTQNAPKMAIHTASNKAGFEASLPTYIPSSYSPKHNVDASPGKVSLTFNAPGDDRLTITQQKSNWDAKSLLDNFVSKQSSQYLAVTGQGLTIYLYQGDVATWVNRGIWYSVQGNNKLNREQLLKIAYGL